ncbi:ribonuclease P protein component [Candidatus Giovannonibacteria bacterium]|nr:ribonuclease P protein component [Candidatus Giovannonibacteria bacterium]
MLPRPHRLSREADFKRILGGKRINSEHFSIRFIKNDLNLCRFAIIISGRLVKKATKRNYIKRVVREVFRKRLESVKRGYDIIILLSKGIKDPNYNTIDNEISPLVNKI